jgi:hypothetical protein
MSRVQLALNVDDLGEAITFYFAAQDKVWVTSPSGERWEVYTVLADSDTFGSNADQTCCTA